MPNDDGCNSNAFCLMTIDDGCNDNALCLRTMDVMVMHYVTWYFM